TASIKNRPAIWPARLTASLSAKAFGAVAKSRLMIRSITPLVSVLPTRRDHAHDRDKSDGGEARPPHHRYFASKGILNAITSEARISPVKIHAPRCAKLSVHPMPK